MPLRPGKLPPTGEIGSITGGGRHTERWLSNEVYSQGYRIGSMSRQKLRLESVAGVLQSIYTDADGDGRRQLWISDVGPGDGFQIPVACQVTGIGNDLYQLHSMTQVQASVPVAQ